MKRNEILGEISLGNYRDKALKQKAQSQMGAMFARDPEERKKNLATFNKREKGLNRLKDRDEKSRKAAADKDMADTIAQLPQLKDEYEQMKAKYKSLGGSNWQYADRDQNLTDREREARSMEGPMNNLWRKINAAEKSQKESVTEGSGANKTDLAMAYLMAVVNAPMGTSEKRRISNWQQILDYKFDIEMDTATLAQMLPQLDSQLQAGKLDKLQNRMISRGELSIESIQQGVAEGEDDGRDKFYYQRNNIWRVMDGDDLVYEYKPERYEVVGAKKLLARFDDEGYDVDRVISPMGTVTYLYGKPMDENANMLKVAKDDDKQTILQNPSTGVQTQIDKTNPNAPSLTKDETTGKLKLAAPAQGGASAIKPNLVGKDVEVATESADLTSILRIAGLR